MYKTNPAFRCYVLDKLGPEVANRTRPIDLHSQYFSEFLAFEEQKKEEEYLRFIRETSDVRDTDSVPIQRPPDNQKPPDNQNVVVAPIPEAAETKITRPDLMTVPDSKVTRIENSVRIPDCPGDSVVVHSTSKEEISSPRNGESSKRLPHKIIDDILGKVKSWNSLPQQYTFPTDLGKHLESLKLLLLELKNRQFLFTIAAENMIHTEQKEIHQLIERHNHILMLVKEHYSACELSIRTFLQKRNGNVPGILSIYNARLEEMLKVLAENHRFLNFTFPDFSRLPPTSFRS